MTGQRPPHNDDPRFMQDDYYPEQGQGRAEPRIAQAGGKQPHTADPYAPYAQHQLDGLPEADAPYPPEFRGGHHHHGQDIYPDQGYAEDDYDDYEEPRRRTPGLAMLGAVFGVVLVVGAGVAGYRYFASESLVMSGEPPLIKAETAPIKVVQEASTTPAEDTPQNKLIYGRIEGGNSANANVVASSEEPVERPAAGPQNSSPLIVSGAGPNNAAPGGQPQSEEDMRRIRTVVIKPETVPGGPEAGANSPEKVAPILDESIKKPAQEGPAQGMALLGDNAVGIMVGGEDDDDAPAAPAAQQPAAQNKPQAPAQNAPQAPAANNPAPQVRPSIDSLAAATPPAAAQAQPQQQAPAAQQPVRTPPATQGGSGFFVQLASHRSDGEARSTYANLQRRYGQVLGQYQPVVQPANLGERGTYYRLRVGPFASRNDALTVCTALKDAGGTCIVQQ